MNRFVFLIIGCAFLMSFGYLQLDVDPIEIGPKQAWYEVSEGIPIDKNISTNNDGSLFFEFHTDLEPKNLKSQNFATIHSPEDYFVSYLVNRTDSLVQFGSQDGSVIMLQEAKNSEGIWTPIEYWQYSWCGNSYFEAPKIESGHYLIIPIKKYQGDFKTEIRLKLKMNKQIFYSDSFVGSVNKNQFRDTTLETLFNQSFLDGPR